MEPPKKMHFFELVEGPHFGRKEIGHSLVHVVKSFSAKNVVFGRTVLLNFDFKIQGGQKKRKSLKNMVNDTISDMLTRIRNANLAYKTNVSLSKTKVHEKICEILEQEGFIEKFYVSETDTNQLIIDLKYQKSTSVGRGGLGKPSITNLKRISKPGLRIYTNSREIPKVLGGMGILILSTSKGLMTDRQARQSHLGGEIMCSVW